MAMRYFDLAPKERKVLLAVADAIKALPKSGDIVEFAPRVLEIMHGVGYNVWAFVDEQPGYFGYFDDRFYMVRQVRNHPVWGKRLFDEINAR